MKLLFFDSIDTATFGGYENWILLTARHMIDRGHTVTIAGRPDSEYLRRAQTYLGEKAEYIDVPISGDFDPRTIQQLRRYLEKAEIDLVTVNFNKDLRLGGLAARWYGRTKVLWRIGLDITKDNFVHRHLTPRLIDGVIVPSEALKAQVTRHGYLTDDMVRVIHNGTEVKDFARPDPQASQTLREKYNLPDDSVIAVSVGRFVDQKGHIYLVEAAPEIVQQHPEIRFLWLGDGHHEQMLKDRISELGLSKYFTFAGMLDSIDDELAGADMMIHPAIEEPFSHGILECMRAGLAIVASKVGGTPEAIEHNRSGLLVPPKQPDKLAKAVNKLLDNPVQMRELGKNAQTRWRKHFTIDVMVDRTEAYFKELAQKKVAHGPVETA